MSRRSYLILFISVAFYLAGCSSTVRYSSVSTVDNDSQSSGDSYTLSGKREMIVETARRYIGTPYCYGGVTTKCFDCSGFVNFVFDKAGIELPRVSSDIYLTGYTVDIATAQPGDLVFFKKGNRINHLGIYIGNNQMIHASTSRGVMIQDLRDSYYSKRFAGIKNVISP